MRARARVSRRTKELLHRLRPGEIAVIDHPDLDETMARELARRGVRAVVNASRSLTGRVPATGAKWLLQSGVPVLDGLGSAVLSIPDGSLVEIRGSWLLWGATSRARGHLLTLAEVEEALCGIQSREDARLREFLINTLAWALRERDLLWLRPQVPSLKVSFAGRDALVVCRGPGFREDLESLAGFVAACRPVKVGVDGGADALLDAGFHPDVCVGDMDSVSSRALRVCTERVVHAYQDGRCPGARRLREMGLGHHIVSCPGTSEDLAILLAEVLGAKRVILVGGHQGAADYWQKGRAGMASALLVRMKMGHRLVSASGWAQVTSAALRPRQVAGLMAAAVLPAVALLVGSGTLAPWVQLLTLQVRVWLGW